MDRVSKELYVKENWRQESKLKRVILSRGAGSVSQINTKQILQLKKCPLVNDNPIANDWAPVSNKDTK